MRKITDLIQSFWLKLKGAVVGILSKKAKNTTANIQRWSIYTSANDITFDVFQTICVDDRFDLLVKSGNPPKEVLILNWLKIYEEYSDAISSSFSFEMDERIETEKLRNKTMLTHLIVSYLALEYDDELVGILKGFGFDFKFNIDNPKAYTKDLGRVITRSKFWILQLREKDLSIKNKQDKSEKPTYKDFAKALFDLSRYAGFEIKANSISALEFATRYVQMGKYYEVQNRKKK